MCKQNFKNKEVLCAPYNENLVSMYLKKKTLVVYTQWYVSECVLPYLHLQPPYPRM